MKRYAVFEWADYEAMGGMNDYVASFDTLEEAIRYAEKVPAPPYYLSYHSDNIEIVNMHSEDFKVVKRYEN